MFRFLVLDRVLTSKLEISFPERTLFGERLTRNG